MDQTKIEVPTEVKKVLVTPQMAKELLEANAHNRRVKENSITRYSNEMKAGRWKENTFELIKIATDGRVLDGQHRLMAVIKSGKPIWFHVVYNVPNNVFDVLDTGSLRSAGDVFKIAGVVNDNVVPAIIQQYFVLRGGKGVTENTKKSHRLTNNQLLDWYFQNENFWQHVTKKAHVWYKAFAKILPPSAFGGFYAFFYSFDNNQANNFMDQLATGLNVENDVISQLRTKLMQDKMSLRKMTLQTKFALIVKTWNAYRTKRIVKLLRFDGEKENFPVAI